MSMQPISRPFGESRDFHLGPSDVSTSDLIEGQHYDADDISRIVHTYDVAKKRENSWFQRNVFISHDWRRYSELTSDYDLFTRWAKEYTCHVADLPDAVNRWGWGTFPAFFNSADISSVDLVNAARDWKEITPEAVLKGPLTFGLADATIRWNSDAYSDSLKAAIAEMPGTQLLEALHDWNGVEREAGEEGFPIPTDIALENSRRMLISMYSISPRRFEIYPTPDGEVAIDASGGFRRSVLLLCDSDGGALCLVNMNGEFRRARYSDTDKLPDGFIREALIELEETSSNNK